MKFIIIATLAVALLANDFQSHLQALEETQFGKTILQTIQMELQTENPIVANLIEMMQDLDQQLDAEQARDDGRIERIQANCDFDIGQLTEIINQATVASITLKSELDGLHPQKAQAVNNLERKINELNDLKAELSFQSKSRGSQNVFYSQILDELEQALFGVNSVKTYFNSYLDVLVKNRRRFDKPEPTFLEEASSFSYDDQPQFEEEENMKALTSFAQVAQKVNKLKHHVKLEGYKALIEMMSALASQAHSQQDDASEAEVLTRKLLSVLKQIEGYIQSERMREDQAEAARQSAFEALEQMFSDQIVQGNEDKSYLEGLIQSLSNRIQSTTNEKFEVDVKVSNKSSEMDDRQVDCRLKRQEFQVDTTSRIGQKKSIAVAVDLISSSLGQLKKELLENAY